MGVGVSAERRRMVAERLSGGQKGEGAEREERCLAVVAGRWEEFWEGSVVAKLLLCVPFLRNGFCVSVYEERRGWGKKEKGKGDEGRKGRGSLGNGLGKK